MAKKKLGSEEREWKSFIDDLFSRKRSDRRYKIPIEYIESLADRIHQTMPTKAILINTLKELYSLSYTKGYFRRMSDATFFKEKREKRLETEWKKELEQIDDFIHPKIINQNSR